MDTPGARPDEDVALSEFLARPRIVGTYTWSTAGAFNTDLLNVCIMDTLMANTNVYNKIRGFYGIRCRLHVRVQMSGSPYHLGRLVGGWQTFGNASNYASAKNKIPLLHVSQLMQLPHVILNPCERVAQEISIPYTSTTDFNVISVSGSSGSYDNFKVRILNPLNETTVASPVSVTFSLYAWMTEVELMCPVFQSEIKGGLSRAGANIKRVISGYASDFARVATNSALTSLGLGSPAEPLHVERQTVRDGPFWYTNGSVVADTLAAHQIVEKKLDNPLNEDEMSVDFIAKKEGFMTRIVWSAGAPANLAAFPVHPGFPVNTATIGGQTGTLTTPLGYCAGAFGMWKGAIRYRIEVVSNSFCRGTLRARYMPDATSAPGYLADCGDVYSKMLDISEGNEIIMDIPYSDPSPWLLCNPMTSLAQVGYTNGFLVVDYIESLQATGVSVEINVYQSSIDVRFAQPWENTGNSRYLTQLSTTPAFQSDVLDTITSIRDFVKLPRVLMNIAEPAVVSTNTHWYFSLFDQVYFANQAKFDPSDGYTDTYTTPLAYWSACYLFRQGGLRYQAFRVRFSDTAPGIKLCQKQNFVTLPIGGNPPVSVSDTFVFATLGSPFSNSVRLQNEANSLIVDSPQITPLNYLFARSDDTFGSSGVVPLPVIEFVVPHCGTAGLQISLMQSAADDFSLSNFMYIPYLQVR